MILRFLLIAAVAGMTGAFALTIRDIFRLADRGCSGWEAEARGNCEAFARYYAINNSVVFGLFAILLVVVLLVLHFKSTGK